MISSYWYVVERSSSVLSRPYTYLDAIVVFDLSRPHMDTNINMFDFATRQAVLCRDIHQKTCYYTTKRKSESTACLRCGKSTTQRSTTPNETKYATRMPVSKISKDELRPKGNTSRGECGASERRPSFAKRSVICEVGDGIQVESARQVWRL